jgi:hypothetical protein
LFRFREKPVAPFHNAAYLTALPFARLAQW